MAPFLSEAWIAELDRAVRESGALDGAAPAAVVVEQRVTGAPTGEVVWHLALGPGGARVMAGPAEAPDVTFSQDLATASAVARGDTSAQAAFMVGRLTVAGDVGVLLDHRAALDGIADLFASVRASTTYDP